MQSKWNIYNLDCAGCANALQMKLSAIKGVNSVDVSFINKTVILDIDKDNFDEVLQQVFLSVKEFQSSLVLEKYSKVKPKKINKKQIIDLSLILISAILLVLFIFVSNKYLRILFLVLSYLLSSYNLFIKAFKNIIKGKIFDENFLMIIASLGAIYLTEYIEAVSVVLLYKIGEYLQQYAINKSRNAIQDLLAIKPEHANLILDNNCEMKTTLDKIDIGDLIVVRTGEKIPLDGVIISGSTTLDCSMLTGESKPIKKDKGEEVLSGCINLGDIIYVEVLKTEEDSTVSKILNSIENSNLKKSKSENFISKFAKYYTPAVILIACLMFIPLIWGALLSECLYRALTFLVVSCPCALVISIPLTFFANLGIASKKGILIKGSSYLEQFKKVNSIVFDKTGTLTKGKFEIVNIENKGLICKEKLLEYVAYAEYNSNHPIAYSIKEKYNKEIDSKKITDYTEIIGKGISCMVEEKTLLVGNFDLMQENNIKAKKVDSYGSIVYVAINNKYAGYLEIKDEIKPESKLMLKYFQKLNKNIEILTGDTQKIALKVSKELDIKSEKVHYELMPENKVEHLESLLSSNQKVCYVGDGINDAPCIARSDISVTMGGIAVSGVVELADIVIMDDNPEKLVDLHKLSVSTNKVLMQNIIITLSIKLIVLLLSGLGIYSSLWLAVLSDVGLSVIAILNSMKHFIFKKKN